MSKFTRTILSSGFFLYRNLECQTDRNSFSFCLAIYFCLYSWTIWGSAHHNTSSLKCWKQVVITILFLSVIKNCSKLFPVGSIWPFCSWRFRCLAQKTVSGIIILEIHLYSWWKPFYGVKANLESEEPLEFNWGKTKSTA